MNKVVKIFSVTLVVLISVTCFTGCATIFKGSTEKVGFSSDPGGADVYVNGILLGKTPFELNMKSNKTYTLEFKKEGYESRNVVLNNSVGGGWVVLDILGGLIPVVIDAATGDWYHLDQDHVNAVLQSQN